MTMRNAAIIQETAMHVLLTNDDGIHAKGLKVMAEHLRRIGEISIVAPDRERSAVSHALTLHHPLRAAQLDACTFAVDGTPTDCVNLGIHNLLRHKPDIVISGINHGANLGDDITYSGTVSAAMEATLMGIPAFAVSLATTTGDADFTSAATFAARLAEIVMRRGLPRDTFLNINVPDIPGDSLGAPRITRQGKRSYEGMIVDKVDPRGRNYYWIGSLEMNFHDIEGTDYHAVSRGHISITPLHLDLTNYDSFRELEAWEIT
jgi:5'/3'-nucleotidase